jgi:hypothetical protein
VLSAQQVAMLRGKDEASEMKEILDIIDNVRAALSGLQGCQAFYEELLAALPQFVAAGAQSAGKSSVVRRISGVMLPEASGLCTRIATLIQMRRGEEQPVRVTLVGPEGETVSEESHTVAEQVRDAVAKAQQTAVARRGGVEFVDDHVIHVHVSGPSRPNVTLVDLPGFHTAEEASTTMVNQMVERYISMPGTLVLHVVKGDQDYGSVLGNDFMRQACKHGGGRVTVLTHCDKLAPSTTLADAERLRTTLKRASEHSSLTFSVHGCAVDDDDELAQLQHLSGFDEQLLEVGASQLSTHLEERMRLHLEQQYPKFISKVEITLASTVARLEVVKEKTPLEILHQMVVAINDNFVAQKQQLMNELRPILEELTSAIKNFELKPVAGNEKQFLESRDDFSEPLEVGQSVYYQDESTLQARRGVRTRSRVSTLST